MGGFEQQRDVTRYVEKDYWVVVRRMQMNVKKSMARFNGLRKVITYFGFFIRNVKEGKCDIREMKRFRKYILQVI